MKRRTCWQQKIFSRSSCNGFRNGLESPTLMDRWRITALGKLVLSLPINEPSECPSSSIWKCVWLQGKREKSVFCSVQRAFHSSVQRAFSFFLCRGFFISILDKRSRRSRGLSVLKSVAETSTVPESEAVRALHKWTQVLNEFLNKFHCIFISGKEHQSSRSCNS